MSLRRRAARPSGSAVSSAASSSASSAPSPPPSASYAATVTRPPRVAVGYCSVPGSLRGGVLYSGATNTDRVVVCDGVGGVRGQLLAAVVDGVGLQGSAVADVVAGSLAPYVCAVRTRAPALPALPGAAGEAREAADAVAAQAWAARAQRTLRLALEDLDAALCATEGGERGVRVDATLSGASVGAALLRGHTLVFAHSGSVRAVLGYEAERSWLRASSSGVSLPRLSHFRQEQVFLERATLQASPMRARRAARRRRAARQRDASVFPPDLGVDSDDSEGEFGGGFALQAVSEALSTRSAKPPPLASAASASSLPPAGPRSDLMSFPNFPRLPPPIQRTMRFAGRGKEEEEEEGGGGEGEGEGEGEERGEEGVREGGNAFVREASRTVAVPLSLDHRPDRPDELARLSACGARVERVRFGDGSYGAYPRVFGARGDVPGLAVSRCLGCSDARSLGVMATPEVSVRSLSRRDQFLIIASDGLWEALSSAQAVAVVRAVLDSVSDGGAADPATLPPLAPLHSPAGVDADGLPLQGVPLVVAADTTPLAGVAGLAATLATDAPIAPPLAAAFDGRKGTRERGEKGEKAGEGKREGKGRRRRRRTLLPPPPATLEVPDLVERLFADRTRNARNARTRAAARAAAEALVAAATRVYEKRRAPRDDISVTVLLFIHAPDPRGAAAAAGAVA